MYEAQKLDDKVFRAAISEGALKPDAKREEFIEWVRAKSDKPARAGRKAFSLPGELYCLYPDEPLLDVHREKLKNAIVEFADTEGVKLAVFAGENLMAQLKDFWAKTPASRI
jgi:hypothetical protein